MQKIMRIFTLTENGKYDKLHISYGYQNTIGEIYLAENDACGMMEKKDKNPQLICDQLSSICSEIDTNEDIYMNFIKINNNKFKRIHLSIKCSLGKTINSNNPGTKFNIDIDHGYELNTETWTILSIEEIERKIDTSQAYSEEI